MLTTTPHLGADMADMVTQPTINKVVKLEALIDTHVLLATVTVCDGRDILLAILLKDYLQSPCSATAVTSARHSSYTHP